MSDNKTLENPAEKTLAVTNGSDSEASDSRCANCGTGLAGPYCHNCGQSAKSMIKVFRELMKELTEDVLGYDSRIKHTIWPLIFKPGQITLDYIRDKRFHYVLPLRLYLITSLVLIVFLQFNTDTSELAKLNNQVEQSEQQKNKNEIDSKTRETKEVKPPEESTNLATDINIEDANIDLAAEEVEDIPFAKELVKKINDNWRDWLKNPEPLVKQIFDVLPYMMFVLLPVFALIMKLFYLFAKRLYIEHLILLLHNHCFIYVVLILQIVFGVVVEFIKPSENVFSSLVTSALDVVGGLLSLWMVIYIFLSLKKVFQQSWTATVIKGGILSTIYMILLLLGFLSTLLISAYQI
ncbi:MAG: DUF3667 domain-containing protein [Kangiellaceae bacterium]|nr:DUF3667 domain-containing protein [Kangiellaceae bacterium]MCW8997422.1 DUF3667 domain-containing protein [Kangiellaceae bacterium]MCW9018118.1 DUF3667 domain-containing protein [Kangiellaceae bacterium]